MLAVRVISREGPPNGDRLIFEDESTLANLLSRLSPPENLLPYSENGFRLWPNELLFHKEKVFFATSKSEALQVIARTSYYRKISHKNSSMALTSLRALNPSAYLDIVEYEMAVWQSKNLKVGADLVVGQSTRRMMQVSWLPLDDQIAGLCLVPSMLLQCTHVRTDNIYLMVSFSWQDTVLVNDIIELDVNDALRSFVLPDIVLPDTDQLKEGCCIKIELLRRGEGIYEPTEIDCIELDNVNLWPRGQAPGRVLELRQRCAKTRPLFRKIKPLPASLTPYSPSPKHVATISKVSLPTPSVMAAQESFDASPAALPSVTDLELLVASMNEAVIEPIGSAGSIEEEGNVDKEEEEAEEDEVENDEEEAQEDDAVLESPTKPHASKRGILPSTPSRELLEFHKAKSEATSAPSPTDRATRRASIIRVEELHAQPTTRSVTRLRKKKVKVTKSTIAREESSTKSLEQAPSSPSLPCEHPVGSVSESHSQETEAPTEPENKIVRKKRSDVASLVKDTLKFFKRAERSKRGPSDKGDDSSSSDDSSDVEMPDPKTFTDVSFIEGKRANRGRKLSPETTPVAPTERSLTKEKTSRTTHGSNGNKVTTSNAMAIASHRPAGEASSSPTSKKLLATTGLSQQQILHQQTRGGNKKKTKRENRHEKDVSPSKYTTIKSKIKSEPSATKPPPAKRRKIRNEEDKHNERKQKKKKDIEEEKKGGTRTKLIEKKGGKRPDVDQQAATRKVKNPQAKINRNATEKASKKRKATEV